MSKTSKIYSFWRRIFGDLVKGDIVEFPLRNGKMMRLVYYSHYEGRGSIVSLIYYDGTFDGTILLKEGPIPKEDFKKLRIIKRIEETGSLEEAWKEVTGR